MDLAAFQNIVTVQNITVFVLAIFVGYQVVWNVTPALHTPLMAVTNAISGIIIVGALLQTEVIGGDEITLTSIIGAVAVFLASINIFGGFMVTRRMCARPAPLIWTLPRGLPMLCTRFTLEKCWLTTARHHLTGRKIWTMPPLPSSNVNWEPWATSTSSLPSPVFTPCGTTCTT